MKRGLVHAEQGKIWPLVAVAVLVTTLLVGAGAVWALKSRHAQDDGEGDAPKKHATKSAKREAGPVFVALETFTVKLQEDQTGQQQYLQLVPALRALDLPSGERIKAYLPQIRHEMLSVMSLKRASELATPQGIEKLAMDLRQRLNQSIGEAKASAAAGEKAGPEEIVQAVLFSSFIIQ